MPTHLIQAMPMLLLGLAALAGVVLLWLRFRRADGEHAATARRDLAVGLALAASWAAIWSLHAMIVLVSVGTLFWLGAGAFHDMYQFPWVDVHISHLVRTFHT